MFNLNFFYTILRFYYACCYKYNYSFLKKKRLIVFLKIPKNVNEKDCDYSILKVTFY